MCVRELLAYPSAWRGQRGRSPQGGAQQSADLRQIGVMRKISSHTVARLETDKGSPRPGPRRGGTVGPGVRTKGRLRLAVVGSETVPPSRAFLHLPSFVLCSAFVICAYFKNSIFSRTECFYFY